MAEQRSYLSGLARLHTLESATERRAVWRQAMVTLGAAVLDQRSAPLEGFSVHAVQASVRLAMAEGLLEELDFLSDSAAAAALYELGAVLPSGPEKRAVGRMVLTELRSGSVITFVVLASQLARGSSRALEGSAIRARVALALDLPFGVGASVDGLALTLLANDERVREWLSEPSTGSLPSRRLAARLLERGAREAVLRHDEGDPSGLQVFQSPVVLASWRRLFRDREPFVWRYVATARGILADVIPQFAAEIYSERDPKLTPMEWRRCATSTAASIARDPAEGVEAATTLLEGPVWEADPGIAAAMVRGLARAAEVELEVVNGLLERLVRMGNLEVMEALLELRREQIHANLGREACRLALGRLDAMLSSADVSDWGQKATMRGLQRELESELAGDREAFTHRIDDVLLKFVHEGPEQALASTDELLEGMSALLQQLEGADTTTERGVAQAHDALAQLDEAMLQRSTCGWLLQLGREDKRQDQVAQRHMDSLFTRLTEWLLEQEREPIKEGEAEVEHLMYRIRRMRFLLHLIDAEEEYVGSGGASKHVLLTTQTLLRRVRKDVPSPLSRVTTAAASRGCDALCRQGVVETSDVLFMVSLHALRREVLGIFSEASTDPSVRLMLESYSGLAEDLRGDKSGSMSSRRSIDRVRTMALALPTSSTPRIDALRSSLLTLARALEHVIQARSLAEVSERGLLGRLEFAIDELAWLVRGSTLRWGAAQGDMSKTESSAAIRMVDYAVEGAKANDSEEVTAELMESIELARGALRNEIPPLVAEVVAKILLRLARLPQLQSGRVDASMPPLTSKLARLPGWIPPSRNLGSFYVIRPLGGGAVGSVFVSRRSEEKHDEEAPLFALKVPEYDGSAARELSEAEFHELFREEAGALLSLPQHSNLARLVTFDAAAKPKPILVMELVQGHTLERLIARGELGCDAVLSIMDGVARGLEVMHRAGIGHLDVKPSNVILREVEGEGLQPVLVDFGLAGRKVRPGCATGEYGAPEIWGAFGADATTSPTSADVYALGCVAYEMITGQTLFEAPNEIAQITAHISHDGEPERVAMLRSIEGGAAVADVLNGMLRHKPENRLSTGEARKALREALEHFQGLSFPLIDVSSQAVA